MQEPAKYLIKLQTFDKVQGYHFLASFVWENTEVLFQRLFYCLLRFDFIATHFEF